MHYEESPGEMPLHGKPMIQDRRFSTAFGGMTTRDATHESWHRNEASSDLDNPFEDSCIGGMNPNSRLVPKLSRRGKVTVSRSPGRPPAEGKVKTKHPTSVWGSFLGSLKKNRRGTGKGSRKAVEMPTTELGSPFVFHDRRRGCVAENRDDVEMSIDDALMMAMPTEGGGQLLGCSADYDCTDPFKTPPRTPRRLSTPQDPRSPLSHTSTKSPRSPMDIVSSPDSTTGSEKRRKVAKRSAASRKKKLQILGYEAREAVDGSDDYIASFD